MDPKVCGKLLTHHRRGYGVDVEALRDRFPLQRSARKRPQDGISRVQKVPTVEIGFCGAPRCFRGIWIYMGGRSRSGEPRGAHEGGGRAQGGGHAPLSRGFLEASLTSTPSLLNCLRSKNNSPKGFIPFGLRLIFLFFKTPKLAKKNSSSGWASS